MFYGEKQGPERDFRYKKRIKILQETLPFWIVPCVLFIVAAVFALPGTRGSWSIFVTASPQDIKRSGKVRNNVVFIELLFKK
jgi:hypothetical protein